MTLLADLSYIAFGVLAAIYYLLGYYFP